MYKYLINMTESLAMLYSNLNRYASSAGKFISFATLGPNGLPKGIP